MAVKASATITLTQYRDTQSVTRYYKLQPAGSSAPLKPETKPPSSDWTDSEPACDISKELYFCDLTIFSNGEGEYSKVSKSTSYEAAKQAYNKANNAQSSIDNLEIGGRNLLQIRNWGRYAGGNVHKDIKNVTIDGYTFTATGNPTDLIGFKVPVEPGNITISGKTGLVSQTIYYTVYDSNHSVVQAQRNSKVTTEDGRFVLMLTMPSGASELHIGFGYYPYSSASGEYTVSNLKIEKGNKATDWTPAPEDVDAGINDVDSKINDVTSNIYAPGSTLLDGSKINDGSLSINQMDDTVAGTYSDPTTKRGTMEWKDDALHIKSVDSNAQNTYETVIGGDGIKFNWNGTETASIDQDELRINKTVVINAMEVGNWSWAIHPTTGNLMVKWNGGK